MMSMDSASGTYHENQMTQYYPDKVTVENPHADFEMDMPTYDVPYEMNGAANARSSSQAASTHLSPYTNTGQVPAANQMNTSEAVANIHYGDPSVLFGNYPPPSSPTYQEPDALAAVSLYKSYWDTFILEF